MKEQKSKEKIMREQIFTVVKAAYEDRAWEKSNVNFSGIPDDEWTRSFFYGGSDLTIYEISKNIELSNEAFAELKSFFYKFDCTWNRENFFSTNGRPIWETMVINERRFISIDKHVFPYWAHKYIAIKEFADHIAHTGF